MLQYLLNTTAIWLMSLVLFDLFLRRESFHSYNRFYLLFTFVLGAFFPLVQWQGSSGHYPATLERPIARVITAKQTVIEATTPAASINWSQWLFIAYLAGALGVFILLLSEIIRLAAYYHSGKRSKQDSWTIIETGKEHAPFSFLGLLFICSREQYSTEEWRMILIHEKRHHALLHFADLLLLQLGRIVFWFHPLVYVYNKRLLLIHEYQADKATAVQPQVYGKFLVEQALLQSSPSISHSFNRSPIKKRIVMLTRRSSAASGIKMLVFIPLALVCFICFSKNSFAQRFERNGNTVKWRGNTIELSQATYDTIVLVDPVTGTELVQIVKHDPKPVKVNGNPIPWDAEVAPQYTGKEKDLRDYVIRSIKDELIKLNDGMYALDITEILVDENGRIIYFDYKDLKRSKTADEIKEEKKWGSPDVVRATDPQVNVTIGGKTSILRKTTDVSHYEEVSKSSQQAIYDKICRLMETAPGFIPGTSGGKKVISTYIEPRFWNHFKIKDHKIYDMDKNMEYKEL